jgi:hypothetical protein
MKLIRYSRGLLRCGIGPLHATVSTEQKIKVHPPFKIRPGFEPAILVAELVSRLAASDDNAMDVMETCT